METVTKETKAAIPSEDFEQRASTPQPSLVQELWDFLRYNKKWWLTPIILVLLLAGLLVLLSQSAAAPFGLHALLARTVAGTTVKRVGCSSEDGFIGEAGAIGAAQPLGNPHSSPPLRPQPRGTLRTVSARRRAISSLAPIPRVNIVQEDILLHLVENRGQVEE